MLVLKNTAKDGQCPVNRDDFEDMRCLISGRSFSYGLAHGKHDNCQFEDTYLYGIPV